MVSILHLLPVMRVPLLREVTSVTVLLGLAAEEMLTFVTDQLLIEVSCVTVLYSLETVENVTGVWESVATVLPLLIVMRLSLLPDVAVLLALEFVESGALETVLSLLIEEPYMSVLSEGYATVLLALVTVEALSTVQEETKPEVTIVSRAL